MVQLIGRDVGVNGYGLMGFTWRPEPIPNDSAIKTMKAALELGATFWNGGEFYGPPERNSLQLLHEYFEKHPEDAEKVTISIKGSMDPKSMQIQGDEKGIRRSVDQCLKLLDGRKKLDLFECARVDRNVPIEQSIAVLAKYVEEGKLGGISLSEAGAETIRRAAKVHPIAAVEVEFSLFSLDILNNGVAEACAELGIPIVAYSPLSRGMLTGQVRSFDDLPEGDLRRRFPRFQPENFAANLQLVDEVERLAKRKGCENSQIALAWVRHQSGRQGMPQIIPIPGSTTLARTTENLKVVDLTEAEFKELDDFAKKCEVAGSRYPEAAASTLFV